MVRSNIYSLRLVILLSNGFPFLKDGEKATTIELQKACRFCLVGVEHGNATPVLIQDERSEISPTTTYTICAEIFIDSGQKAKWNQQARNR